MDLKCFRCGSWPCDCKDGQTIIHGDCRDVIPAIGQMEFMLTDPPYGITQQKWDCVEAVCFALENSELAVFTTGERLLSSLITSYPDRFRHVWIWDRVNHNTDFLNAARRPMRAHELVAVFSFKSQYKFTPVMREGYQVSRRTQPSNGNGTYGKAGVERSVGAVKTKLHPRSIIAFKGCKTNSQLHPTEKPVALYRYLLDTYPSKTVVDPFMGSGTTLRAAKDSRRRCIGIEIEERYCEIAAGRLRQEVFF